MPGPVHEALLALLTNYPALPFELASRCGARVHGRHEHVHPGSSVFQDPGDPARQLVADGVVVGWAILDGLLQPVDCVVLEVQLRRDWRKLVTWLVYRAGARSRYGCRAWVLVVSPDPRVRERIRQMFRDEPELCPLIVEPELIPVIVDPFRARRDPGMAVLSAVMHARSEFAVACARAAVAGLIGVPGAARRCYLSLLMATLTEEQMSEVAEQLPDPIKDDWELCSLELTSAFYTRTFRDATDAGTKHGLELGMQRGLEEGRTRGLEEGRTRGLEEGRTRGLEEVRETLLEALAARGLELTTTQRACIESCADARQLSRWLLRVSSVSAASELLDARD